MAALAFERATEDLDEESSHLESSALNSPRSNQGSIADLRAWDQQHDDRSMKNVPMEAQSPSEAQLLPGRKFPPQQQDDEETVTTTSKSNGSGFMKVGKDAARLEEELEFLQQNPSK